MRSEQKRSEKRARPRFASLCESNTDTLITVKLKLHLCFTKGDGSSQVELYFFQLGDFFVVTTIDDMVQMGLHFGHHARNWNPKMAPYIHSKRNGVHIIDLIQTYFYLKKASQFLTESAAQGKTFLFVGTKKQATGLISKAAIESQSFYINQRWLGGMLSNWHTMTSSIMRLNELEMREKYGGFEKLPKKEAALLRKQKERLEKYLGGVKRMGWIPDILIIVGQPDEMNAVRECRKLGRRSLTILDTDCDPSLADLFVPANDDSVPSLKFLLSTFVDAIQKGRTLREERRNEIDERARRREIEDKRRGVVSPASLPSPGD
jgi:small subunit ribosomal protein S2